MAITDTFWSKYSLNIGIYTHTTLLMKSRRWRNWRKEKRVVHLLKNNSQSIYYQLGSCLRPCRHNSRLPWSLSSWAACLREEAEANGDLTHGNRDHDMLVWEWAHRRVCSSQTWEQQRSLKGTSSPSNEYTDKAICQRVWVWLIGHEPFLCDLLLSP